MQRAGFALAALALSVFACAPRVEPRSPSTPGHDDVAGSDDDRADGGAPAPSPNGPIGPSGNQRVRSFDEAKRALRQIYERHRVDLYCGCTFAPGPGHGLHVDLLGCGYVVARDAERAGRIEWEHAVAASTFGRTFTEWTTGDDRCVDGKGKRFKGRRCAGKSAEFARMEGDLHNLFPVVGEVNALRSDLPMGLLEPPDRAPAHRKPTNDVFTFGACKSTVERGVFFPRPEVRGDLARAALYMDSAYPSRHILDDARRALFDRWSAEDPPDDWERERNRAIAARQGNDNPFITGDAPALSAP
ncbi:MAG: endonuclease [Labilithrix sp.]|nr:endonuclease [Labilithrix sp.]